MVIYKATKDRFLKDSRENIIGEAVKADFEAHLGKAHESEVKAWENSLRYMAKVVDTPEISGDTTICVEYRLPNSGHRIDFLISGRNEKGESNVVIVELKQWSKAEVVEERKVVNTFVGGRNRDVTHPSYQALSYALTLENYVEAVRENSIHLFPCAYLHNYVYFSGDKIFDSSVFPEINDSPLFFSDGEEKLRTFIKEHVTLPDTNDTMSLIDNGKLRPSVSLQDVLGNILKGKKEFILLDDQKVYYENIMAYVRRSTIGSGHRNVFIIQGGPGTGKSVLAINLLASSIREGHMAAYVSKNSAPRNVYEHILTNKDRFRKTKIHELFLGSGSFVSTKENSYDALFVDEAHRLNAKSGIFHNIGENQIKEIILSSRISVFLIDEKQQITTQDIGSVEEIRYWAEKCGAYIHEARLESQFRCNGSDGYLSFLDDVLDIRHDYYTFDEDEYSITVMDSPKEMMERIKALNGTDNKSRMLAGYCWNWDSKKDKTAMDIKMEEFDFQARWNFADTSTWAIDEDSVNEIGCIHTSQGLEFSYVGVIIGDDMRFEDGKVITDYSKRAKTDKSLSGILGLCRKKDPLALKKADAIIRNTYRTLLSRGMKGCLVYCTDEKLSLYLKARLEENRARTKAFLSQSKLS